MHRSIFSISCLFGKQHFHTNTYTWSTVLFVAERKHADTKQTNNVGSRVLFHCICAGKKCSDDVKWCITRSKYLSNQYIKLLSGLKRCFLFCFFFSLNCIQHPALMRILQPLIIPSISKQLFCLNISVYVCLLSVLKRIKVSFGINEMECKHAERQCLVAI